MCCLSAGSLVVGRPHSPALCWLPPFGFPFVPLLLLLTVHIYWPRSLRGFELLESLCPQSACLPTVCVLARTGRLFCIFLYNVENIIFDCGPYFMASIFEGF